MFVTGLQQDGAGRILHFDLATPKTIVKDDSGIRLGLNAITAVAPGRPFALI